MDADGLRSLLTARLPIAPTQIFPISAHLALRAQLAQHLTDLETPPSWFPAFAEASFVQHWQQEVQNPRAVAEAEQVSWRESGFAEVFAALPQWLAGDELQNAIAAVLLVHLAEATAHLTWQKGQYLEAQGHIETAKTLYAAAKDVLWTQLSLGQLFQQKADISDAIAIYETLNQPKTGEVHAMAQWALGKNYESQARYYDSLAAYQAAASQAAADVTSMEDRLASAETQKPADPPA